LKPLAASGGARIQPWGPDSRPPDWGHYFQQRIVGSSHSALYLANAQRQTCQLIGATAQLLGGAGAASEFSYRGSLGPIRLKPSLRATLARLGDTLATEFALRGLFGVDFVMRGDSPWPVEVNPRYTASAEVYELAGCAPLIRAQALLGFGQTVDLAAYASVHPAPFRVGKLIVTAPCDFVVPEWRAHGRSLQAAGLGFPPIADIPLGGTEFPIGAPVLTILERARDIPTCLARLRARAARWRARIRAWGRRQRAQGLRIGAGDDPGH
jgi:predicted ATP-grasp superfamily ATP-dependent carboligase